MHGGASQPSDEEGPARGCKCKPGKLTGELSEEEVAVSLITAGYEPGVLEHQIPANQRELAPRNHIGSPYIMVGVFLSEGNTCICRCCSLHRHRL